MDKEQSSEDLVADEFDVYRGESFSSLMFDEVVEVSVVVSHGYVEELSIFFEGGEGA